MKEQNSKDLFIEKLREQGYFKTPILFDTSPTLECYVQGTILDEGGERIFMEDVKTLRKSHFGLIREFLMRFERGYIQKMLDNRRGVYVGEVSYPKEIINKKQPIYKLKTPQSI